MPGLDGLNSNAAIAVAEPSAEALVCRELRTAGRRRRNCRVAERRAHSGWMIGTQARRFGVPSGRRGDLARARTRYGLRVMLAVGATWTDVVAIAPMRFPMSPSRR